MLTSQIFLYAVMGGIIPALLWLHFWLKEDSAHPEPRELIMRTFLLGMVATVIALALEQFVNSFIPTESVMAVVLWAIIEESTKFGAAYFAALRTRYFDEPIDAVVYMVTAALGFSALENVLFVLDPLVTGDPIQTIITTNLRFIGASLLHIIASGVIGVLMAFAFYKSRARKAWAIAFGLIIAVVLHTLFNFFIIADESQHALIVFGCVWCGVIGLILLTERIKFIKNTN